MYAWIQRAFEAQIVRHQDKGPLPAPATESVLTGLRTMAGGSLPASYEAFLRRHDGLPTLFGTDLLVLSAEQVIAWHTAWSPFAPFAERVELPDDGDEYYRAKPRHHLVVRRYAFGNEVATLDMSSTAGREAPVVDYDVDLEPPLRPRYPSFEAMLLNEIAEAAARDAPKFRQELLDVLTARGARNAGDFEVDFAGWRHQAASSE